MDPKDNLSEEELEAILSGFIQDPEAQVPETEEEIIAFVKSLDVKDVPTPNVAKFERFLSERLDNAPQTESDPIFGGVLNGLRKALFPKVLPQAGAVAARKGKKITPEIREKMDKAKKKNGHK